MSALKPFLRLLSYAWRYPRLSLTQWILSALSTLLVLVFPELIRYFFDVIIPQKLAHQVLPMTVLAMAAMGLRQLLLGLKTLVHQFYEQRVLFDLRCQLFEAIQSLPIPHYRKLGTGEIMTRVTEDVPAMEKVLVEGVEQGITAIIQVIIIMAMMTWISPQLTILALIPLPFILWGTQVYHRDTRPKMEATRNSTSALNAALHDQIIGLPQLKLLNAYQPILQKLTLKAKALNEAQVRASKPFAIYLSSMNFLGELGLLGVVGIGTWWTLQGTLTTGGILSFVFMLGFLYEPVTRLQSLHQVFLTGIVAAKRVFGLMDAPPEKHLQSGKPLELSPNQPAIQFRQVSYSYVQEDGLNIPVLQHLNLDLSPGLTYALVGKTGTGKSTLLNLLVSFDTPQEGSIWIHGHDLATLNKQSLRESMGYVPQDPVFFDCTLLENLLLAKPEAHDEEIWKALEAAHMADWVKQHPEGLHLKVGESACQLSGGEKQRLALARSFLRNPPLLLLDEATSSLDQKTQVDLLQSLKALRHGKTTLMVSHDLKAIHGVDQILVLDEGKIVERGTHADLMAIHGKYAALATQHEFHPI